MELMPAIEAVIDERVAEIGSELAQLGDGMDTSLCSASWRDDYMTLAELRGEMDKGRA